MFDSVVYLSLFLKGFIIGFFKNGTRIKSPFAFPYSDKPECVFVCLFVHLSCQNRPMGDVFAETLLEGQRAFYPGPAKIARFPGKCISSLKNFSTHAKPW